jgi:hypothetical protein
MVPRFITVWGFVGIPLCVAGSALALLDALQERFERDEAVALRLFSWVMTVGSASASSVVPSSGLAPTCIRTISPARAPASTGGHRLY